MFSTKTQQQRQDNVNNNNSKEATISSTATPSSILSTFINGSSCAGSTLQGQQSQSTGSFYSSSTTSANSAGTFPAMLSAAASMLDQQNANCRDRTHLTLDFKDLKPREPSNSGLSPISLPMSLLDSNLLISPEKILLAAQHQQFQAPKLETPTPSNFIFPKHVTTAQETFAEGFQKALQKLQGDSSLPTFQNNSPSTVKFLLSLAALTPTLSPSAPNKTLLGAQFQRAANELGSSSGGGATERKLELPKIVLNHNHHHSANNNNNAAAAALVNAAAAATVNSIAAATTAAAASNSTVTAADSSSSLNPAQGNNTSVAAANDLAKRYMEYFQIGQQAISSASSSATSSGGSISEFNNNSQSHQQIIPQFGAHQKTQPQIQPPSSFIKKEPQNNFGKDPQQSPQQQDQAMLMLDECTAMVGQIGGGGPQIQLNGGQMGANPSGSGGSQQQNGGGPGRRKDSLSSNGEQMGEHDIKKLERKRARNRLAASKCRQRKLQRISDLEAQVAEERVRGSELEEEILRLQNIIKALQAKLNGGGGPTM